MASGNGNEGVLRRMVNLVSTPAKPAGGDAGSQFADEERAELKAMIERKRRNDAVRKREFDMLRRIRREGLSGEAPVAGGASSRLGFDDVDPKPQQAPMGGSVRSVKAKIDAIEKQMVGSGSSMASPHPPATAVPTVTTPPRRMPPPQPAARPTVPGMLDSRPALEPTLPMSLDMPTSTPPKRVPPQDAPTRAMDLGATSGRNRVGNPSTTPPSTQPPLGSRSPGMAARPPAAAPAPRAAAPAPAVRPTPLPEVEVSEVVHDHELDEAVIAFANADFAHCERLLVQLTSRNGSRYAHIDTWLVLCDLYRATGQQTRFDTISSDFTQHFQRSGPQWFSLPSLVAEASGASAARAGHTEIGWICPAMLDADGVAHLDSQTLQLPQPWILDWRQLRHLEVEAAGRLQKLLAQWSTRPIEMRWLNAERLVTVLQEASPVGVRDADPAYWLTRLEVLRLINRVDQFDELAIDYCVTYEVSPPSWEPSRCTTRLGDSALAAQSAPMSVIGDAITTTQDANDGDSMSVVTLELSGQLSGDIAAQMTVLDSRLGEALIVRISCALLIRVDFIAAGDLLNWVIAKRAEGRHISFTEVHRLVGLMFGAMGITEHSTVKLRQV